MLLPKKTKRYQIRPFERPIDSIGILSIKMDLIVAITKEGKCESFERAGRVGSQAATVEILEAVERLYVKFLILVHLKH